MAYCAKSAGSHMIVDALGRRFRNLRVSLTVACNYACTYCVPDGKRLQAAEHELDGDELAYAVLAESGHLGFSEHAQENDNFEASTACRIPLHANNAFHIFGR